MAESKTGGIVGIIADEVRFLPLRQTLRSFPCRRELDEKRPRQKYLPSSLVKVHRFL